VTAPDAAEAMRTLLRQVRQRQRFVARDLAETTRFRDPVVRAGLRIEAGRYAKAERALLAAAEAMGMTTAPRFAEHLPEPQRADALALSGELAARLGEP